MYEESHSSSNHSGPGPWRVPAELGAFSRCWRTWPTEGLAKPGYAAYHDKWKVIHQACLSQMDAVYEYLRQIYGENEPILLKKVHTLGMTDAPVWQALKKLTDLCRLKRCDRGIYFLPWTRPWQALTVWGLFTRCQGAQTIRRKPGGTLHEKY